MLRIGRSCHRCGRDRLPREKEQQPARQPDRQRGQRQLYQVRQRLRREVPEVVQRQEKRLRMVRYVRRLVHADRLRICGRAAPALPAREIRGRRLHLLPHVLREAEPLSRQGSQARRPDLFQHRALQEQRQPHRPRREGGRQQGLHHRGQHLRPSGPPLLLPERQLHRSAMAARPTTQSPGTPTRAARRRAAVPPAK